MLEFKAKGTIKELEQLFPWNELCLMISVDFYNYHRVPADEIFEITENHLQIIGILPKENND